MSSPAYRRDVAEYRWPGALREAHPNCQTNFGRLFIFQLLTLPFYRIVRRSTVWDRIITNTLNIPQCKPLHGTTRPQIPFAFVADEAFGRFLLHIKRIFNYRLSRARRYIECTFGILSNKLLIFHILLNVDLDLFTNIVKACCVLHNYVRSRDDTLSIEGLEEANDAAMDDNVNCWLHVNHIRNIWVEYFVSNVGMVPWKNYR
ncbi:hypothetical protein PR048_033072, partial [Dryococelus australis]